MNARTQTLLITCTLALSAAAPVQAYKIGGDVTQSASVDNVITSSIGSRTFARSDINTLNEGANIGGSVRQTFTGDNVITSAIGSRASACTSINVLGQKDCGQR